MKGPGHTEMCGQVPFFVGPFISGHKRALFTEVNPLDVKLGGLDGKVSGVKVVRERGKPVLFIVYRKYIRHTSCIVSVCLWFSKE